MFLSALIEILLLIAFIWAAWRWIVKPLVKSSGIEVDEEKEVKTDHTKRLEKAKTEYKEKQASVHAAREEELLKTSIKRFDKDIKDIDRKIEDMK